MSCGLCLARKGRHDQVVFEDDLVFVLVNHEPVKDPHIMVLPVRCVSDMRLLQPEESHALLQLCDRLMDAMERTLTESPMMLVNGVGFRTEPQHLHVHILPSQYSLRGLFHASEGRPERQRSTLEESREMARLVRSLLADTE